MITPLSVVRWVAFKQIATHGKSHISPVATFAVATVLGLSGVWDGMLYLLTRAWIFRTKNKNDPQAPEPLAIVEKENGYQSPSMRSGFRSI